MAVMVVCLQVTRDGAGPGCRAGLQRSEPLRPQQRVGQVKQQSRRDETGECVIKDHGCAPSERFSAIGSRQKTRKNLEYLKPLAGIGVTDSQHEEAKAQGQHDDVQHECSFAYCTAQVLRVAGRPVAVDQLESEPQPVP
jgi:hypothetical protein